MPRGGLAHVSPNGHPSGSPPARWCIVSNAIAASRRAMTDRVRVMNAGRIGVLMLLSPMRFPWRLCRLDVVHGRCRFRLIGVQHAFSDNFRDGDLLNGVARGAYSSDDHGAIWLPESFHCVLCRTPARAGARCRHVPDWLRGNGGRRRRFHTREAHLRNRRVAVFLAIDDLFYVSGRLGQSWAWHHRLGVGEVAVGLSDDCGQPPMLLRRVPARRCNAPLGVRSPVGGPIAGARRC